MFVKHLIRGNEDANSLKETSEDEIQKSSGGDLNSERFR